ncbi:MAG: hypothetical protein EA371_13475 [Gammaproteobacteria bacterium]|nr:MAG: hypothetical protein EA371_13475 [Gammaproteobacteria bacterium]
MLERLVDEDQAEPVWANDPWAGNEAARRAWCAAMADTHQSDWGPGMIPGEVRGQGEDLEKATRTEDFFKTATAAFERLTKATQPDELREHAVAAKQLVATEKGVYRNLGWNYTHALQSGATMAPPLGTRFAMELSEHLTPLTLTQERWCWTDPADRG